jgi:hypothetical protein
MSSAGGERSHTQAPDLPELKVAPNKHYAECRLPPMRTAGADLENFIMNAAPSLYDNLEDFISNNPAAILSLPVRKP